MPWNLEHKLCTRLGFVVKARAGREWVELEKVKGSWKPELLDNGELPENVQNYLRNRMNNIVNRFEHPEGHVRIIRTRINNFAQTLPPFQRKFVTEWMERNVVEDD